LNFFANYQSFLLKYAPFETPTMDDEVLMGLVCAWGCCECGGLGGKEGDVTQGVDQRVAETVGAGKITNATVAAAAGEAAFMEPFLAQCIEEMSQALPVEQAEGYRLPVHPGAFRHRTEVSCSCDGLLYLYT